MTKVLMKTSMGDIEIELNEEKAPNTCKNFVSYVKEGFYNGTVFHRVIKDFMIQGGGFTEPLQQKKGNDPIANEADNGLANDKGTIAMARTMEPHSASSQFFINLKDNDFLNHQSKANGQTWGYAVFGKVTKGMDVVEEIGAVRTGRHMGMADVPVEPVIIEQLSVIED